MSMSGKIAANSGFVTKADFMRLQSKVDGILTRLAEQEARTVQQSAPSPSLISNRKLTGGVKSWLYSKAGSRTPRTQRAASDVHATCQNCGKFDSGGVHRCDQTSDAGKHIFQKHTNEEGFGGNDNHRSLRNELNQLQADVSRDMRLLQKSVKDAREFCQSLEKLILDSLANMQVTIEKMNKQIQENTERLNQHGSPTNERGLTNTRNDRNRDGLNSDLDAAVPCQRLRNFTHTFEWEVTNMDSIVKNLKDVSSQPYHIKDMNYKMSATAAGCKDGILRLKIYGEFVQATTKTFQRKYGKFECAVYVIDTAGKQSDWFLGNVGGDFNKDKELMVGDVYPNEAKRKGYVTRDGNLKLRFDLEVLI